MDQEEKHTKQFVQCKSCFVTSQFPGANIDSDGYCHWCRETMQGKPKDGMRDIDYPGLMEIAEKIKGERVGKYDCIIGVSGGLDSSYMAYIAGKLMGLNALLVNYDHGFYYELPKQNLSALSQDLNLELRTYRSKNGWDKHYVKAIMKAFSKPKLYWGICDFCHYILPATIVKIGREENIKYYISHSNQYELSMHVPREVKMKAMIKGVLESGIKNLPAVMFHILMAKYYFFRLKLEFFTPPMKNLFMKAPSKPFITINLTKFVPWDIDRMKRDLTRDTGWRTPEHPNLGMRFDCMIEDSLINKSYHQVTGMTVHSIIANNLIYDQKETRESLSDVVDHYHGIVDNRCSQIAEKLHK